MGWTESAAFGLQFWTEARVVSTPPAFLFGQILQPWRRGIDRQLSLCLVTGSLGLGRPTMHNLGCISSTEYTICAVIIIGLRWNGDSFAQCSLTGDAHGKVKGCSGGSSPRHESPIDTSRFSVCMFKSCLCDSMPITALQLHVWVSLECG